GCLEAFAPIGQVPRYTLVLTLEKTYVLRSGRQFLIDPTSNRIEYLSAVVLQHHEVPVAEDPFVLQVHRFCVASGLLQKRDRRLPASAGFFGNHINHRHAQEVLQLPSGGGRELAGAAILSGSGET